MAKTSSGTSSSAASAKAKKPGAEFLCKVRYKNPLPPLPFAPKLLPNPTQSTEEQLTQQLSFLNQQQQQSSSSAAQLSSRCADWLRRYEMPLLAPFDLGIPLDLIRLRAYELSDCGKRQLEVDRQKFGEPSPPEPVSEEDEPLLIDPAQLRKDQQQQQQQRHRPLVSWLRRTEYISTEGSKVIGRQTHGADPLLAHRLQAQYAKNPSLFKRTREDQIRAIEKTFVDIKKVDQLVAEKRLVHPNKGADVYPVESWELAPNWSCFPDMYLQCTFNEDPMTMSKSMKQKSNDQKSVDQNSPNSQILKAFEVPGYPGNVFFGQYLAVDSAPTGQENKMQVDSDDENDAQIVSEREYRYNRRYDSIAKPLEAGARIIIQLPSTDTESPKDDEANTNKKRKRATYTPIKWLTTLKKQRKHQQPTPAQLAREQVGVPTRLTLRMHAMTAEEGELREEKLVDELHVHRKRNEPMADDKDE